jgi:hypothetical protein
MTLVAAGITMLVGVIAVMGIIYLIDKNSSKHIHKSH